MARTSTSKQSPSKGQDARQLRLTPGIAVPSPPPKKTLWTRTWRRVKQTWPTNDPHGTRKQVPNRSRAKSSQSKKLQKQPPISASQQSLSQQPTGSRLAPQSQDATIYAAHQQGGTEPEHAVKKRHSVFGLSGLLEAFSFDLEKSFITPEEKRILQHMYAVTCAGRFQGSGTREPSILFMPDGDSTVALQAIRKLTRQYTLDDKEILCQDLDRLLTKDQRAVLRRVLHSDIVIRCEGADGSLISLGNSQLSEGVTRVRSSSARCVKFVRASRRAPRFVDPNAIDPPEDCILVRHDIEISRDSTCLRGGGGDKDASSRPTFDLSNLVHSPRRLGADERPHPTLWWLAGGRFRRDKPNKGVPTAAELRERRVVEDMDRERVSFWGTVAGMRKVKCTRSQLARACQQIAEADNAAEGTGRRVAPHDSVTAAVSTGGDAVEKLGESGASINGFASHGKEPVDEEVSRMAERIEAAVNRNQEQAKAQEFSAKKKVHFDSTAKGDGEAATAS
ncbi:hypothetical protein B0A50_07098 [Salinomyces thailandicus]|uniref:Uncharacterized protein n=1 Tax=Salinomyces thailandicus TaxID=706561 RepID=A0A4U0TNG0_9PEZI|nr:hypothetical protein B0A50_07098 [Salinomyces thailandica]